MNDNYETDDARIAAVLLTLGHQLVGRSISPQGRVSFRFTGVHPEFLDRVLDSSPEMKILRKFIGDLEAIYSVINQTKRGRLR